MNFLLSLLVATAAAQEVEFRRFVLQDGRVLDAQVVATEDAGFRVRVPQGELLIPYELFADMQTIDAATYERQAPWNVWLAGPEREGESVRLAVQAIPGTRVMNGDAGPSRSRAAACGANIDCITRVFEGQTPAPWVVAFAPNRDRWHLDIARGTVDPVFRKDVEPAANAVLSTLYDAFGVKPVGPLPDLTPKPAPPPEVAVEPSPAPTPSVPPAASVSDDGPWTATTSTPVENPGRRATVARAWVPVPGYGALRDGDYARFAMGMATAIPATALWAGAVGSNAQTPAQHIAMTLAGYYVASVVVNQVFESRAAQVAVGVAPGPHGAHATLVVRR